MGTQPAGGGQAAGVGGSVAGIVAGNERVATTGVLDPKVKVEIVVGFSVRVLESPGTFPSSMAIEKLPITMLTERMAKPNPINMERRFRILILFFAGFTFDRQKCADG